MKYGYGRCSTDETKQDLRRQERELKIAGAEEIYLEYAHGTDAVKPELEKLLDKATEGDTIIVVEISRLSRSTKQLCELIELIRDRKLCLDIIGSIKVDCRNGVLDPMTNAFLQMAGVFAELERQMIAERTRSGLAKAKANGQTLGRPTLTADTLPESFLKYYPMYEEGMINKCEFARLAGVTRQSVYKYLTIIEAVCC